MTADINNVIHNFLETELGLLLQNAERNKESRDLTRTLGISEPHLVPFVTGIIYEILQERFTDVCRLTIHRNPTQHDLVNLFLPYWQSQVDHIQKKLMRIYQL